MSDERLRVGKRDAGNGKGEDAGVYKRLKVPTEADQYVCVRVACEKHCLEKHH